MTSRPSGSTTSARCLTLELTGPLERLVGTPVLELPVDSSSRLGAVLASLVDQHPDAAAHLSSSDSLRCSDGPLPPGFLVIRDGVAVPARLETPVRPGDRLTLLSFISGG
jgi:sulfur carrier protein ThiS